MPRENNPGQLPVLSESNPLLRFMDTSMPAAEASELDLADIADLVRRSEIDLGTLRCHIREMLQRQTQASIGEHLAAFLADQGLGSVVGYIHLGARPGEQTPAFETVSWQGEDKTRRSARVPTIHFLKERMHELAD